MTVLGGGTDRKRKESRVVAGHSREDDSLEEGGGREEGLGCFGMSGKIEKK